MHSVPVYRYNLSESVYDRVKNDTDCYDTVPSLPAGISDASKCYFGKVSNNNMQNVGMYST